MSVFLTDISKLKLYGGARPAKGFGSHKLQNQYAKLLEASVKSTVREHSRILTGTHQCLPSTFCKLNLNSFFFPSCQIGVQLLLEVGTFI